MTKITMRFILLNFIVFVPKVEGQFGTNRSIFSPYGLTDIEVYGDSSDEIRIMMNEFQQENAGSGLQRFGTERARLPPGRGKK